MYHDRLYQLYDDKHRLLAGKDQLHLPVILMGKLVPRGTTSLKRMACGVGN